MWGRLACPPAFDFDFELNLPPVITGQAKCPNVWTRIGFSSDRDHSRLDDRGVPGRYSQDMYLRLEIVVNSGLVPFTLRSMLVH